MIYPEHELCSAPNKRPVTGNWESNHEGNGISKADLPQLQNH